ncbi:MAG TPA: mucoidy inhibitor MuiA family protein [Chitinophagaceae bacterium]|nr:mucoidy inhibitor MuiA family protein [Chitinophagaceae bacterium]
MKPIVLIGFLVGLTRFGSAQEKLELTSKVEKVTVFLDGAQVERSYRGPLPAGTRQLIFDDISPDIDKESLQVNVSGDLSVISVLCQQNFLKQQTQQEEMSRLSQEQESLEEKRTGLQNMLAVYDQEQASLVKNQSIGGSNGLKTADLKEALDFQRARWMDIYQHRRETNRSLRTLDSSLSRIRRQILSLQQQSGLSTSEVLVTVQNQQNGIATVTLRYLIRKAGWVPSYDIRVRDIQQPILIQFRATIFQQSGEDWKDVKLLLSTGNPWLKGDKPVITPWYMGFGTYVRPLPGLLAGKMYPGEVVGRLVDDAGNPLAGATVGIKGTRLATATDNQGIFHLPANTPWVVVSVQAVGYETREFSAFSGSQWMVTLVPLVQHLDEVVVNGYTSQMATRDRDAEPGANESGKQPGNLEVIKTYQPTTVVYEIKGPYSVPADGKSYTADIDAYEVHASYAYYAVPKLEPTAYLTASLTDWQDLSLQPGNANLFFEGTYLGKSFLDITNAGDTLKLSLGRDNGVVVKREMLKQFSSRKLLGRNRTESRVYQITVRNNKQQPVHLTIEDQFPISTDKEIEIQDKKYEGAQLSENTQLLAWQLDIDPRKETRVQFGYVIKYPKDRPLNLTY